MSFSGEASSKTATSSSRTERDLPNEKNVKFEDVTKDREPATVDNAVLDDAALDTNSSSPRGVGGGFALRDGDSAARRKPKEEESFDMDVAVFRHCLMIYFVFLAFPVPIIIFLAGSTIENTKFENEYESLSIQVADSVALFMTTVVTTMGSLSIAATSHAITTNSTWPFVTMWDFDYDASSVMELTDASSVSLSPYVTADERKEWEDYVVQNIDWLWKGLDRQENFLNSSVSSSDSGRYLQVQNEGNLSKEQEGEVDFSAGYSKTIYRLSTESDNSTAAVLWEESKGPYFPNWHSVPLSPTSVNLNVGASPIDQEAAFAAYETGEIVTSRLETSEDYDPVADIIVERYNDFLRRIRNDPNATYEGQPIFNVFYPVFDTFNVSSRTPAALLRATFFWERVFVNTLPPGANGIVVVVANDCQDEFTYQLDGQKFIFHGYGDLHDIKYTNYKKTYEIFSANQTVDFGLQVPPFAKDHCSYTLRIYPSSTLQKSSQSNEKLYIALSVFGFAVVLAMVVFSYDWIASRRVRRIVQTEKKTKQIISAHFPTLVRDRLLSSKNSASPFLGDEGRSGTFFAHPKRALKTYLDDGTSHHQHIDDDDIAISGVLGHAPIADLFLHCTVLFMDISGFSAWSSERGPDQVFTLLETVFQAFDKIAERRGVFKVETIGDSYVAVTGLPEPQDDHAIRMVRFARDSLAKARDVAQELETTLGPGTADLQFRFGLHSGAVTAGVLRGEKARFQLFGDTVNTASRMESTGAGNRIQLSETTAQLLIDAGRSDWVKHRDDEVHVKGKGVVNTYWLVKEIDQHLPVREQKGTTDEVASSATPKIGINVAMSLDQSKNHRLVSWLAELMKEQLRRIAAQRQTRRLASFSWNAIDADSCILRGKTVLDEVVDAFVMPKLNAKTFQYRVDPNSIVISDDVHEQLYCFVHIIATKYRKNPFHNFDHASHVTMSAVKLLNRVAVPEDIEVDANNLGQVASDLHEYTYGITSDAMAQFAVLFSTLIHDVDHRGVPNQQLVKELPGLGDRYGYRSVAEQNSVDIAWNLLMEPDFSDLRKCIFGNESEVIRFRKYVVNLVMATDIFEKRMKKQRDARWNKAFGPDNVSLVSSADEGPAIPEGEGANLKATIILEHIIQAADVAHTMQHWRVYKKWNEKLFQEMYAAYDCGRSDTDPSEGWYKGELWFFDYYVIPLAKRLEECGVFGVSSDECYSYALQNRQEWERKGKDIVEEMVERYRDVKRVK